MKTRWNYNPNQNSFPLPREVFELGLERGALLVYLFLIHHKYLKHGADRLNCAAISKAVGLCEKTVRSHLRTLANSGFIRMESEGQSFSYTLRPIRGNAQEQCNVDLFPTHEGGRSA